MGWKRRCGGCESGARSNAPANEAPPPGRGPAPHLLVLRRLPPRRADGGGVALAVRPRHRHVQVLPRQEEGHVLLGGVGVGWGRLGAVGWGRLVRAGLDAEGWERLVWPV